MISMRQRGLLVAGWLIAAVVTSLVAAGAVAAAGGQVSDRPLRPLTAAEVAALPVVVTADVSGPCVPLASGGDACRDDALAVGVKADGPVESDSSVPVGEREGTGEGTPAGVPHLLADDPLPEVTPEVEYPEAISNPDFDPVPSDTAVVHLEGGSASVAGSGNDVYFIWAVSHPGYLSEVQRGDEPNSLLVVFSNASRQSVLKASWNGDELILESIEGVL